MKVTEDMAMGFFGGVGLAFLSIYLIQEWQKQQIIQLGQEAIGSGMFNGIISQNMSPSNSSPNMSGSL